MNRTPPTARCRRTAFDEVECTIPFHAELIAAWKREVPYSRRSYDPDTKAWRFLADYRDLAIALLLKYFPAAEVPNRPWSQAHAQSHPVGDDPYGVLHLNPSAPPEVVDAAFRALAKMFHPDKAGDPAVMRRLIEAHDALTRRLSA